LKLNAELRRGVGEFHDVIEIAVATAHVIERKLARMLAGGRSKF